MAQIGKRNSLTVLHSTPHGIYLDGGEHGEILLPNRYIPKGTSIGDVLDVFIYRDSEDRLVATTETPLRHRG
jgi:predicted RNA-binding protein (virulence factor B family)